MHALERVLDDAVRRRTTIPMLGKLSSIGILFSGGIDSMMIAILADRYISSMASIDLINVAFAPTLCSSHDVFLEVPDRLTGQAGIIELK
jgi:asparagine synthetase B (glutamine-hydrolysing)